MSALSSTFASSRPARALYALLALILGVSLYRYGARELLGLGLHFEEAQYWVWSLDPGLGYFSKPPMVAWAIGAARALCGDETACIRMPSLLALGLATVAVYGVGARLFDVRTGLIAAAVYLLAPITAFLSWVITTDSLLLLFWAVALYAFVRALESDRLSWWIATGAAAGLGLLSKYTMGVFALSAAGLVLTTPVLRQRLLQPGPLVRMATGALLAALIFAPNVYWNITHQFATIGHTAEISRLESAAVDLTRGLRFIAEQFIVFGPLALALLLVAAWRGAPPATQRHPRAVTAMALRPSVLPTLDLAAHSARHPTQRSNFRSTPRSSPHPNPHPHQYVRPLLLWFTLPFLLIITAQALAARAHANWAAPSYVAAAVLVAAWLASRPRWMIATLAVNVIVMVGFYHYRQVLPAAGIELPAKRDPYVLLQGWDRVGSAVGAQLDATGARLLTDERRVLSWLAYYAGPRARDALIWNPERHVDNHYRLTRDVAHAAAGPFLFVAERERGEELERQFESVQALGTLTSGPCAGCERTLYAYQLGAFRGYAP